jgi:hypothetical protein
MASKLAVESIGGKTQASPDFFYQVAEMDRPTWLSHAELVTWGAAKLVGSERGKVMIQPRARLLPLAVPVLWVPSGPYSGWPLACRKLMACRVKSR